MNALILETLFNKEKGISQRELASKLGISLGKVNEELRQLKNNGLINQNNNVTEKGKKVLEASHPQRAIILAAGYGMRMVPINMEEPKGLLEVNQEPLIERLIKQLHKVGVYEIHIVVGFMKEHYEYLIDKYDVGLIVNSHYSEYKNMYSLLLAKDYLVNSYILPCDVWFKGNPFNRIENESYYLFSNQDVSNSIWRVQPRGSVKKTSAKQLGNRMVGLAYISYLDAISIMHSLDHAQINQ